MKKVSVVSMMWSKFTAPKIHIPKMVALCDLRVKFWSSEVQRSPISDNCAALRANLRWTNKLLSSWRTMSTTVTMATRSRMLQRAELMGVLVSYDAWETDDESKQWNEKVCAGLLSTGQSKSHPVHGRAAGQPLAAARTKNVEELALCGETPESPPVAARAPAIARRRGGNMTLSLKTGR